MASIQVCSDSSALLPQEEETRLGVTVVLVHVVLDGEPFDGDTDELYERLEAGARATTSAPSPGELLAAYRELAAGGAAEVSSLHLDARVSGTVAAAELAAREAPIRVRVLDTRATSFGVALCPRAQAWAPAYGLGAEDAVESVQAGKLSAQCVRAFCRRGRPSRSDSGWKVLSLSEGRVVGKDSCSSPEEAVRVMAAEIGGHRERVAVAVGHASRRVEPGADELAASLLGFPSVVGVERYRPAPSVGAHTGPRAFGVFCYPAPG